MAKLKTVTLYRGLNCSPQDYQPTALARSSISIPGRKETPQDIWVHRELRGALSYATGLMNGNLSARKRGPFSKSVVLELTIPNRDLKWRDGDRDLKGRDGGQDRATFSRADIPDDRAILTRIAIHGRQKRGEAPTLEWFSKDAFFAEMAAPTPTAS